MSGGGESGDSSQFARKRLQSERSNFRKDRPFGFFARCEANEDGSQDLFKWKCGIPGKKGTDWYVRMYIAYTYMMHACAEASTFRAACLLRYGHCPSLPYPFPNIDD